MCARATQLRTTDSVLVWWQQHRQCRNAPVHDVVLWCHANLRLWSLATTVTKLGFLNTTAADTCCGNAATVKLNFHNTEVVKMKVSLISKYQSRI